VEEGEDLEELSERVRKKQQAANKLLKDTETFGRGTPASDDSRGRKAKKGKAKVGNDVGLSATGKRKRGRKSLSVSPSVADEEDDDRDQVSVAVRIYYLELMAEHRTMVLNRSVARPKSRLRLPSRTR
jgi:hypothetical protein